MSRELLRLDAWRFTTVSALAREILALLEHSNYKLEIRLNAKEMEQLSNELESCRTLGRVTLKVGVDDQEKQEIES